MSSPGQAVPDAAVDQGPLPAGIMGGALEPHQLDLLRDGDGNLPSNVYQLARTEERKRGRPPGSRNKRSTNLAAMLEAKYPDPVLWQAALFSMPLDQLCEMLLIADGTIARQQRLDELLDDLTGTVSGLIKAHRGRGLAPETVDRLAEACEALESAARSRASKPGDVALKALNIQLAAARTVSEYRHSKKPTEVVAKVNHDAVMVLPAAQKSADFGAVDEVTRMAGEGIAKLLAKGTLTAADIAGVQLVNGQLVHEAEFEEVDDEGAGE